MCRSAAACRGGYRPAGRADRATLDKRVGAMWLCATFSPIGGIRACIATAPIPAARSATATSAAEVRLSGWCHRIRDHGGVLFIDLRDHYGLTQVVADPDSPAFKIAETLRAEWVVRVDGKVRRRPDGTENRRPADRRGRGLRPRDRGAGAGRRIADAGVRRPGISRGYPAQIPLPRSAPRAAAQQHHDARPGHQFDPAAHEGAGLLRIPDADPHRLVARRRARLSGAVAPASGKVLRAAAGAAAVQAAAS